MVLISSMFLLVASGCKHKDNAPPLATSASTTSPLAGARGLPSIASAAPSVGEFEGEIGLLAKGKLSGNGAAPLALTLRIKGGKVRVDLPESLTQTYGLGPGALLVQPADKKAYAVLDARKQAVLLDLDKLTEQAKAVGLRARPAGSPDPAASTTPRLERTGKFDTVADTKCEIWRFNQGKNAGEACIAEQATPWLQLPIEPHAPSEISWMSELADGKHLPLRFVSLENNVEQGRVEVSSIQQKTLPPSLFEVPADYAVLSLEQMMASMMGGLGSPRLPPGVRLPHGAKQPSGAKPPPALTPPSK
jgi:hypothetical protein